MRHKVPHGLSLDLAKKAARAAAVSYGERFAKYSPKTVWKTETHASVQFSVPGTTLEGTLEVSTSEIVFDLDVPFLFRPFKGTAIEIVDREIKIWVGKAKAGELS